MKKHFVKVIFFLFILTSCVGPTIVNLQSSFDVEQAKELLKEGNNTIKGSALIRQKGGGIITCAGLDVWLYPVTDYATERIQYIYGKNEKGFSNVKDIFWAHERISFQPDIEEYYLYSKKTIGDTQGNFEFEKLKNGEYYILTFIYWHVNSSVAGGFITPRGGFLFHNFNVSNIEGGTLMQRVRVEGGEIKKVVLAP